jgi:cell division protein FtsN
MTNRDEFDDHEGFQSAFGKIASAMEQGRSGLRHRGPMLGILTALVALFVLFAVFWSTYPRGDAERAGVGPVPLVRADATPFKSAPDDPGGMDIPYRDSTVFETLRSANNTGTDSKVESLLPAPEEPIAREQMFAGLKTEPLAQPAPEPTEEIAELDAGPVQVADAKDKDAAQTGAILPKAEAPAAIKTAKVEETKVEAATAAKTEPAAGNEKDRTGATGTHYIQLGSVKARAGAEAEWAKMKKEFPAELGGLSLRIQDVTLGDRGTFYRIQGGSVAQARAKEICAAINAKKSGGCIVVAR